MPSRHRATAMGGRRAVGLGVALALVSSLAALAAPATATATPGSPAAGLPGGPAVTVTTDVAYKTFTTTSGQTDTLTIDVYQPDSPPPPAGYPAVVAVHGARENGDKHSMQAEATTFAQDGYLVFAPNYRLTCDPTHPPRRIDAGLCGFAWPSPVEDLEDAVRWVRSAAGTYTVDLSEIGAFGSSSGGNFAMLLGTLDYGVPKLQAVAEISGEAEIWRYDLSPHASLEGALDTDYMGCDYSVCPQDWYDASPQPAVTPDDPPTYMANGLWEPIPLQEALDMQSTLAASGIPAFVRVGPGTTHGADLEPVVAAGCCTTIMDEVVAWMDTYLKPGPQADLALTGTATPANVTAGSPLMYQLTATNDGPMWASGVTLTDSVPSGVALISATASQGSCSGPATVVCDLGQVGPNSAPTVTIVVTPNAKSTIHDSASVSGSGPATDPVSSNDSVTLTTSARAQVTADLSVGMTTSRSTVKANKRLSYTMTVTNHGPNTVNTVTLTDLLAPGIVFDSASPSRGSCSGTANVTCVLGKMVTGSSATVKIVISPAVPGPLSNTASVAGNATDPNLADDSATASATVKNAGGFAYVGATDTGYVPSTLDTTMGTSVQWDVPAGSTWGHQAADESGMGLFDSGVLDPGWYFVYRVTAAGRFTVHDDVVLAAGRVEVVPTVAPSAGGVGTTFTVTWATQPAASGFVSDVQVRRPEGGWVDWNTAQTDPSATFVPDAGTGTYSFRARLRSTAAGSPSSGWSPSAAIVVS